MTSQVVRELKKKAERLMGGYNASEKDTIATNLNLYTCLLYTSVPRCTIR